MRIRTLFIAAILPVVVAVNLFYAYFLVDKERERALGGLHSSIAGAARLLKVVIAEPLYAGNVEALESNFDAFFADPNVVEMTLQEYGGTIRIARGRPPGGPLGETLESRVVIVRGRDDLGVARMVYSTALIEEQLLRSRDRIVASAAILAVLVSAVIFLVTQRLTGPLARLNRAARAIADGHLDEPVQGSGAREMASLAESFVRMRDAVRSKMADLAETNERLRQENEARQKLASAVENSSDFIGIARLDGAIDFVNPAGLRMVGLPALGTEPRHRVADFIPAEDQDGFAKVLESVMTRGNWLGEFRLRRLDTGAPVPVELNAFRIDDPASGKPIAIATVTRDITERKRADEETRKLQAQLLQSQKMEAVGRLAGGVAHDFNNLLTVINAYAELVLARNGLAADLREAVELIRQAGESAASLTRQLLAFSRKQVLQPKTLDLNALVASMNRMLQRVIGEDVRLVTRLADDLWPVRVDPGQVEQVIMNLAVNARDAMPEGGTLTIETANVVLDEGYARRHAEVRAGPYVMLATSDTGHGMDDATLRQVFEPFFTTKGQLGTGLGLSTVYGIVQQSGGHVSAHSEPGLGTTFEVYFPRQATAAAPEEVAARRRPAEARGETILVAEDSEGVRRLVRQVLAGCGYDVLEARNGEEAVQVAAAHPGPIHHLLTDVVMPGASGRDASERIQAARPETKVLFMSGYTEDAILTKGVLESGIDFLEKPFTPGALEDKVRAVLGARDPPA
jgi:PAS domain S-box-containing protein